MHKNDIRTPLPERIKRQVAWSNRRARQVDQVADLIVAEWTDALFGSDGRCFYCDERVGLGALTLDHLVPIARGGGSDRTNVVPSCYTCNVKKNGRTIEEFRFGLSPPRKRLERFELAPPTGYVTIETAAAFLWLGRVEFRDLCLGICGRWTRWIVGRRLVPWGDVLQVARVLRQRGAAH